MPTTKRDVESMELPGGAIEILDEELGSTEVLKYPLDTKELYFQVTVEDEFEPRVVVRPYRAGHLKQLLADSGARFTVESGETEIKQADLSPMLDFFWKHFLRMDGLVHEDDTPATVEEQKEFIKDHPRYRIEELVVRQGYGGAVIYFGDEGGQKKLVLKKRTPKVQTFVPFFDPTEELAHRLEIVHSFRKETEFDFRKFAQATSKSKMNRKSEFMRIEEYTVIEHLYNDMIQGISGVDYPSKDGKRLLCVKETRDTWRDLIPFWWKYLVLNHHFRGVTLKNA